MDFSMWIQSPTDLGMLFLSAMLIGMSKTGIQGISLLAVPLMAMTFGAKPSTGLILPILCVADLVAVLYYRRIAEWKYVLKLLPAALAGFVVALLVDKHVPPAEFKHLMGGAVCSPCSSSCFGQNGRERKTACPPTGGMGRFSDFWAVLLL